MSFTTVFDVWVQATNTVYKGVPFGVVSDWAQQGRLAPKDKLRSAGSNEPWVTADAHPIISDYLFTKSAEAPTTKPGAAYEPVEMDVGWSRRAEEEESDPDMIPLIDVSLVLLIFFMMTATVAVSSPIAVPQMKNVADIKGDPNSLLIKIDKLPNGEVEYSLSLGNKPVEANAAGLQSLTGILGVLDAKLNEILSRDPRPPEVHIACHEDLPSDRVQDLANELEKRKADGKVAMYGAQVTEVQK